MFKKTQNVRNTCLAPERFRFADDGLVANNPVLSCAVVRQGVDLAGSARHDDRIMATFERNGWIGMWRPDMFDCLKARELVRRVPLPPTDPLNGETSPLLSLWTAEARAAADDSNGTASRPPRLPADLRRPRERSDAELDLASLPRTAAVRQLAERTLAARQPTDGSRSASWGPATGLRSRRSRIGTSGLSTP